MTRSDWQKTFGEPGASFDARFQYTLNHLEEGKPMKRLTLRTALLALALILALTGVVYAATNGWQIGEYFNARWTGSYVNAPKDFESGYAQQLSQQAGDILFTIRDAYIEGDTMHAIITFARADGKPALFLATDFMPSDSIAGLILDPQDSRAQDARTIEQYAKDNGMALYEVNTWFTQKEGRVESGAQDVWLEQDGTTALYYNIDRGIHTENGTAKLEWSALVMGEEGERIIAAKEIELKAEEVNAWEVQVNERVEDLPLILDTVFLREGRMGTYVDLAYHVDLDSDFKEIIQNIQTGRLAFWFEMIDPETGETLPGGPTMEGSLDSPDDIHFTQTGDSISADFSGDTLYFRAYDGYEKTRYGTVAVKIR